MRFVLLNDVQRKEIIDVVKPSRDDRFSYSNLNLLTAVYDGETESYLTLAYFLPEFIKRSNDTDPYDEYKFVLLTPDTIHLLFVGRNYGARVFKDIKSPCPAVVSDRKLLDMLSYYRCHSAQRDELIHSLAERDNKPVSDYYGFTEKYLISNGYFSKMTKAEKNTFKTVLLTNEHRDRIIKIAKPEKGRTETYKNLELLTGAYDAQTKVLLTMAYFDDSMVVHGTAQYYDQKFVLLTPQEGYLISVRKYLGEGKYRAVESPCPLIISDSKLCSLMNFHAYDIIPRRMLSKLVTDLLPNNEDGKIDVFNFSEWYLENGGYFFDNTE